MGMEWALDELELMDSSHEVRNKGEGLIRGDEEDVVMNGSGFCSV